jgi:hypothetical protein
MPTQLEVFSALSDRASGSAAGQGPAGADAASASARGLPALSELRGQWWGVMRLTGGLSGPDALDFALHGKDWAWGEARRPEGSAAAAHRAAASAVPSSWPRRPGADGEAATADAAVAHSAGSTGGGVWLFDRLAVVGCADGREGVALEELALDSGAAAARRTRGRGRCTCAGTCAECSCARSPAAGPARLRASGSLLCARQVGIASRSKGCRRPALHGASWRSCVWKPMAAPRPAPQDARVSLSGFPLSALDPLAAAVPSLERAAAAARARHAAGIASPLAGGAAGVQHGLPTTAAVTASPRSTRPPPTQSTRPWRRTPGHPAACPPSARSPGQAPGRCDPGPGAAPAGGHA